MKIKYEILWLDDQINDFIEDGWKEKIEQHLIDEGFEPNVVTISRVDDFFSKLNGSFDLILTDFHMTTKNGDEIVSDIRKKNIQTEILFYTAKADLQANEKIDRITFLETTSDHYSEVIDATKKLINLTIRKFQHIITMRGMIMHETSILDDQTTKILLSSMKSGKISCEQLIDTICSKLTDFLNKKKTTVQNIQQRRDYKELIRDTFLFSSEYKIDTMKTILQNLSLLDFTDDYRKEIIRLRNKFAHAVLETDEMGRQYFKSGEDGITFDETLCKTMRKNINKHKKNIDDLEKEVKKLNGG